MREYVGFVMLLSFFVDLLLLGGTDRLLGICSSVRSVVSAAAIGAAYTGISLLSTSLLISGLVTRLVVLFVMTLAGGNFSFQKVSTFILLTISVGMIANGFAGIHTEELLVTIVCMFVQFVAAKRVDNKDTVMPVELTYRGKTKTILALIDTGNGLRDPITGERVIVISHKIAEDFTGLTKDQLSKPSENLHRLPGGRLIPYRAIGTDNGLLMAVRFPVVSVGRRKSSALVAFAPSGFQGDCSFQALVGRG